MFRLRQRRATITNTARVSFRAVVRISRVLVRLPDQYDHDTRRMPNHPRRTNVCVTDLSLYKSISNGTLMPTYLHDCGHCACHSIVDSGRFRTAYDKVAKKIFFSTLIDRPFCRRSGCLASCWQMMYLIRTAQSHIDSSVYTG